jgi:hypothetical protein
MNPVLEPSPATVTRSTYVRSPRTARWSGAALWVLATVAMLAAAVHQRSTGPTYPLRGEQEVGAETIRYALIRSETTTTEARVQIPDPGEGVEGHLAYRRYPLAEPYTLLPLERSGDALVAHLPRQPAAGKLEYHLVLDGATGYVRIPASADQDPVLRYKDPVPVAALLPHVILMFLAMLIGVRAGLGALLGRPEARRLAWTALGLMTVGGMILGPIVQKYAFGAFWTGFPLGYDLTDNKTLLMWLVWVGACGALGWRWVGTRRERAGRAAVVLATILMLAVYLVPHSLRGSQLDYERLEQGVDPADAIRTGR